MLGDDPQQRWRHRALLVLCFFAGVVGGPLAILVIILVLEGLGRWL